MNKRKEILQNQDWYEILNQNLKYVNKDFDHLDNKRKEIMKEHYKLNKVQLIGSNFENKLKQKNEIKNATDIGIPYPDENKLIYNRLNIKNYKTKNYISINGDSAFLKDILEKMDKINTKKVFKKKNKNIPNNININEFIFTNKSKYTPNKFKDKNFTKDNHHNINIMFKTYNKYDTNNSTNSMNNTNTNMNSPNSTYFPNIKNNKDKIICRSYKSHKSNTNTKRNIMRMVLVEEDDTVHRGKSITDNILKLNKNFIKNKNIICGYNDKNEDYIIINNKKIYQINLEKEMNKNYRDNFLNIKKLKDIEDKIFNDNKNVFETTKKNLILKYQHKKKIKNNNFN